MNSARIADAVFRYGACCALGTIALAAAGCASHHDLARDSISSTAPYSKSIAGSGDTVCWSVKRAMLSQGYMLDRPAESGVLTGTRDFQPTPKLNVTLRMQTTCADNRDGTSVVFATATREDSRLQKMKQTTSVGVGPATLTMPSGSAKVLGVVSRQTIQDPQFYAEFFKLVDSYVGQERLSEARRAHSGEESEQASNQPTRNQPHAAND
jgi:hypothetical protein